MHQPRIRSTSSSQASEPPNYSYTPDSPSPFLLSPYIATSPQNQIHDTYAISSTETPPNMSLALGKHSYSTSTQTHQSFTNTSQSRLPILCRLRRNSSLPRRLPRRPESRDQVRQRHLRLYAQERWEGGVLAYRSQRDRHRGSRRGA